MMTVHDRATITLNGEPITTASRIVLDERAEEPFTFGVSEPFTITATMEGAGSIDAFCDLVPTQPTPVNVTVTWDILGPLTFPAWVHDTTAQQDGNGVNVGVEMVPNERALRRALSMAIQSAISFRPARVAVISRATFGDDMALSRQALDVLRRRGERKKQRAMRRLLRVAGVTARQEPR